MRITLFFTITITGERIVACAVSVIFCVKYDGHVIALDRSFSWRQSARQHQLQTHMKSGRQLTALWKRRQETLATATSNSTVHEKVI